jgi:polysaccharide export outer membrane protein
MCIRMLVFVALLVAPLTGCKTDESFDSTTNATATQSDGITSVAAPPTSATRVSSHPQTQTKTPTIQDATAAQTVESLAAVSTPNSRAYRIGPLDVLDISVFAAPDLSKTVEVNEYGMIDLPLLGDTQAAGKTARELQQDINSKLGTKYLQNPQTTVTVKEYNSNRVTVSGAVKNPGVFPYKGETLLQFVTMAGGLAPEANSMVVVVREDNGKRSAAKFNVANIQNGNAEDPRMQSGDVIVADTSVMKKGLNNILKVLPLAGFAALL